MQLRTSSLAQNCAEVPGEKEEKKKSSFKEQVEITGQLLPQRPGGDFLAFRDIN